MANTGWSISTGDLALGSLRGVILPAATGIGAGVVSVVAGLAPGVPVWVGALGFAVFAGLGVWISGRRAAAWAGRVGSVSRVLSALEDAADGERRGEALRVVEDGSAVIAAWNRLLEERSGAELRREVEAAVTAVSGVGGDMAARAISALPIGVIAVDAFGVVSACNGAAWAMLGLEREIRVGAEAAGELGPGALAEALAEVAAAGGSRALTLSGAGVGGAGVGGGGGGVGGGDGGAVISARVRAMKSYREGREVLIALEDVTQQHAAARARGLFVAHAAHELRAPLTNIKLYVEEAIEAGAGSGAGAGSAGVVASALNVIQTEARRLERVVGEMLGASEVESGSLSVARRELKLGPMIEDLRADFGALAEAKGLELVFELPPKYPVAFADREKLALAIHNLVGNAIKYTPEGGRVTVRVEADEERLVVGVSDTGIGIAEADRERVFERFFRVDDERVRAQTGTGLGLCLAREVARRHGGDVSLESEVGVGSRFTLSIPIGAGGGVGGGAGGVSGGVAGVGVRTAA